MNTNCFTIALRLSILKAYMTANG